MSRKEKFIEFIEVGLMSKIDMNEVDPDIVSYWEAFKVVQEKEKPAFTDNGKMVMNFLQSKPFGESFRAKDIAEELFVSSRTVSGAMRRIVADGYADKMGENPVMYTLTEKGKNIEII